MSDAHDLEGRTERDPFADMQRGRSLRGSPILKLAKGEAVRVEIQEIVSRDISPDDPQDEDDWVVQQINALQKRGEDIESLPVITLTLTPLESYKDSDGNEHAEGETLLFTRAIKNQFWDSFSKYASTAAGKPRKVPFPVTITRLSGDYGTYLVTS